ncbi:hypothetical protein [Natrialba sp. INN-245]|uniref:hypothetical protein n=1 Tax=Natrialba sp. INN-245 TaxID=2690967 RepID=UPI00131237FD|nr:hypothetical protein [Natrialba sp. INN-245]MWV39940.1 hypothetical protein [Natrialba sp. INN-245]
MIETGTLFLALVFSISGVLGGLNGCRIYTEEQRTRARRLWIAYFTGSLLESAVGIAVFVWVFTSGMPSVWLFPALTVLPLPMILVQWRMHRKMEFESRFDGWLSNHA